MARLLVVEDDLLQQDVLRSALEKRGHQVETAEDGLTAIQKLRSGGYDLALMDYHLPEIDGFASARLLREVMSDVDRPKLIAITATADALSRREVDNPVFDAIVQKPLALSALLTMVDAQLRAGDSGKATVSAGEAWREFGLAKTPAVIAIPAPDAVRERLLRQFFDLSGQREPEAVLLIGPDAESDAVAMRTHTLHYTLPFIDLSGLHAASDASFSVTDRGSWHVVAETIARFAQHRLSLNQGLLATTDPATRLLIYLFLSGRDFQPAFDFTRRHCVRYPGFFPDDDTYAVAEQLANRGALRRRFFERFHVCASCGSSRLNVREECPACQSSDLREIALVHHFRCAFQAPESEFVRGPHLVCPKCRQHLRHYGSDYDRPGNAITCITCGIISPDPGVGFVCLDCGVRTDGNAAATRDTYTYALTDDGITLLRRGCPRVVTDVTIDGRSTLPAVIKEKLVRSDRPAAVIEVYYDARERIRGRRGQTGFLAMRRLFIENLVNALEAVCDLDAGPDTDILSIEGDPSMITAELTPALLEACQEVLAERLEPRVRVLNAPILEAALR